VADGGDGLVGVEERLHEGDRVLVGAQRVGVGHAAGQHQTVVRVGVGVGERVVDVEGVGLVEWLKAWTWPFSTETRTGWPPASATASHGEVSSICSMPSFATAKAIFLPVRSVMASTLGRGRPSDTTQRGGTALPPAPDRD
jgi:hypothetical protein